MSLSPLTFTGISSYSQDFQTIINRALQIASLPGDSSRAREILGWKPEVTF